MMHSSCSHYDSYASFAASAVKTQAKAESDRDKALRNARKQARQVKELRAGRPDQRQMRDYLLADAFERRAPWISGVKIDGQVYGRSTRHNDPRLRQFFDAFPESLTGRVLESGSLEGALTLELAKRAREVVGLEARPESVGKAQFLKRLFRAKNVSFSVANLEEEDLSRHGRFDVIFCCGLLYHLPSPRSFVEQMACASENLYLDTHFSPDDWPLTERDGLVGWVRQEGGWEQPQSGVSEDAFWPTLEELRRLLSESGYTSIQTLSEHPNNRNGPRVRLAANIP